MSLKISIGKPYAHRHSKIHCFNLDLCNSRNLNRLSIKTSFAFPRMESIRHAEQIRQRSPAPCLLFPGPRPTPLVQSIRQKSTTKCDCCEGRPSRGTLEQSGNPRDLVLSLFGIFLPCRGNRAVVALLSLSQAQEPTRGIAALKEAEEYTLHSSPIVLPRHQRDLC